LEGVSDDEALVRRRQANIGKQLQLTDLKYLLKHPPKTFSEALRCVQIGLNQECEALGLNQPKPQREKFIQRLKDEIKRKKENTVSQS